MEDFMKNELIKTENNLPANLDDLSKFVLIGKEKLVSVKAEIRAMKNLKVAEDVYKQKEIEARELGGALLLAKVRIGELLKEIPKDTKFKGNQYKRSIDNVVDSPKEPKQEKVKDLGFSQKESERFQQLADNKDIVEQVIENSEDIPTQTECLKKIQEKKKSEKRQSIKFNEVTTKSKGINIYNTDKKYNIIYADPAWQYWETGMHNQSNHYKTMTLEEICNLPIKNIADENCILFLWVTFPILQDCFKVIESWGFKYSTCGFNWVKRNKKADSYFFGLGSWTRANSELCLIATKGKIERLD